MAGAQEDDLVVKILIVTGSFPPAKCGVGEYSYCLAQALAANNSNQVGVLTSSLVGSEDRDIPGVRIFRNVSDWTLSSLIPTLRFISGYEPDCVHIQYPTQGYDGPLAKFLPFLLRLQRIPVVQTWHEHYSECDAVGWPNLLACSALIHVQPDLPRRLPRWVQIALGDTPVTLIRNASTIPVVPFDRSELERLKREISPERPIVCFFGFANPNKGVERLFGIADPAIHHLLLLCDLDAANPYHAAILQRSRENPWAGHVTVAGFQPAYRVAACLAVADAVVFPFPNGTGEWNTSLQAAAATGALALATTRDPSLYGYDAVTNVCFCGCDQIPEMRDALARYLGRRVAPQAHSPWNEIAVTHESVYRSVCPEASPQ